MRGMQAGLLAGVSAAALFCAAGAHAQAADEPTTVEDIVVTAQKREQSLQSVPVAVTLWVRSARVTVVVVKTGVGAGRFSHQ